MMGQLIGEKHCELNRQGVIPLFSDILLESIISASYERKFAPQVFFLWNETQKAYAFDYTMLRNETVNWVLDGHFKNSTLSFRAPRILPWQLFKLYMWREEIMGRYFLLIGNYLLKWMDKYLPRWVI